MQSNLEYALAYARIGWSVLPLHWIMDGSLCSCGDAECRTPGKHPLTRKGVKECSRDPDVIAGWWSKWPSANVGAATGAVSGITVLDVDPRNGGEAPTGMPDTPMAITGGGGQHYVFAYYRNVPGKLGAGLDVKGDGGYIVVEPSNHISGGTYNWDSMSSPLEGVACAHFPTNLLPASATASTHAGVAFLPPSEVNAIRSALSFINPDEREDWIAVGQALKSSDAGDQAFGLWDEWSKGSDKYDPSDMRKRWASLDGDRTGIGSIINRAKARGWVPAPSLDVPVVAPTTAAADLSNREPAPALLYRPPGVMQDVVDWINRTSRYRQPLLAVSAALSLTATAMARRYDFDGARTNLQQFIVAPSGSGKDHSRNAIKVALEAANLGHRIAGEEIKSGSGLYWRAKENPDAIFLLDEFGHTLAACNSPNAGSHQREIMTAMTKLYSSTGTTVRGAEYADQKARPRADVEFPCLNIYCTTTQGQLYSAFSSSQAMSGFLNRFLLIETETPDPEEDFDKAALKPVPEHILKWLRTLANPKGQGNLEGTPISPIKCVADSTATHLLREFSIECRELKEAAKAEGERELWVRAAEYAKKVALVVAGGINAEKTVVTGEAASWGIAYVRHWTRYMQFVAATKIADSPHEALRRAIWESLARRGEEGIAKGSLHRYCRAYASAPTWEREEALKALTEDRQIETRMVKAARGPAAAVLVALDRDGDA